MPIYHIRVSGHLAEHYAAWFDPLTIRHEPNGISRLSGELPDQGALFGILLKIRDLGLPLLGITPWPEPLRRPATPASLTVKPPFDGEMSMAEQQVTVIAYLSVPPGSEPLFLERFPTIVLQTRREPGCLNYDFHQHAAEPHRFVFYENYRDQAAFNAHLDQPYIREWVAFTESHGGRFDVDFWTMLSEPSAATEQGGSHE